MASNAEWCLSEESWRERFTQWLSEPTPEALLRANIFFDFRPLAGDRTLTERLSEWLLARTQDNKLFLRLMVANALQTEPPLGLIRAFSVDDDGPHAGTLDLKTRGTRIFVDAARVFALANGVAETGTAERLRIAGDMLRIERRHVDATVEAFHYLQVLRLRSQGRGDQPTTPNRIDPYALNDIDQRMLREALRQARKLQQQLKETYSMSL
jgi:CBS domain-containing protein